MLAHRMAAAIPIVERTDDAYPACIWSPYREADTGHALELAGMCAKPLVKAAVAAFGKKVPVELT